MLKGSAKNNKLSTDSTKIEIIQQVLACKEEVKSAVEKTVLEAALVNWKARWVKLPRG